MSSGSLKIVQASKDEYKCSGVFYNSTKYTSLHLITVLYAEEYSILLNIAPCIARTKFEL